MGRRERETWDTMRQRHIDEEEAWVRGLLEEHDWRVAPAARTAGIAIGTLLRAIDRHDDVRSKVRARRAEARAQ